MWFAPLQSKHWTCVCELVNCRLHIEYVSLFLDVNDKMMSHSFSRLHIHNDSYEDEENYGRLLINPYFSHISLGKMLEEKQAVRPFCFFEGNKSKTINAT